MEVEEVVERRIEPRKLKKQLKDMEK